MMLRCDDKGTWVWFRLTSQAGRKITWSLDEYLFHVASSADMPQLRARLFTSGVIQKLSPEEAFQCEQQTPASIPAEKKLPAVAGRAA